MADIELLIRIPEEDYRSFKEDEKYIRENAETESYSLDRLEVALLNGTPLPKGHGDLVDRNDLSLMTVHMVDGVFICDAPTIIEADKEKE